MYRGENSVMKKYLRKPYDIDGWRLDVAPEAGRRGSEQLCRDLWMDVNRELRKVKKDLYIVGEDWDDSTLFLQGDMWNATMNYYGSGRPLRSWTGERDRFLIPGYGHAPDEEENFTAEDMCAFFKAAVDSVPGQTPYLQMNLIDSHDTPRLHNHTKIFDRDIYKGVLLALYMLPGMPNIYYGDEVLLSGTIDSNEGARYPMEWREEYQDKDMLSYVRMLGEIRKDEDLAYSASLFRALDEKAFALIRVTGSKAWAAVINRGEGREVGLDLEFLPSAGASVILGDGRTEVRDNRLFITLGEKRSLLILLV